MRVFRLRSQLGAGIAIITLVIGALLVGSLGFFSFEIIRHNTASDELRSACEAAALAAAAAMASSDSTDATVTHNNAIAAAQETFRRNNIVGKNLNDVDTRGLNRSNFSSFMAPNDKSAIYVEFLDPDSSPPNQPVTDLSSTKGRIVHVGAVFTNEPPFGKFLGIPAAPIRTSADGRVPQLDVVMCFDTSGSIDDQTPVTFVRRIWKADRNKNLGSAKDTVGGGTGANLYMVCPGRSGSPTPDGLAQGKIYDILYPSPIGSGLQAIPPQSLDSSDDDVNKRKYTFERKMRTNNPSGLGDAGPPGNYPLGGDPYNQFSYSDAVVNIDGKETFGGTTITSAGVTYEFPDVATLVEAARGNLDSDAKFKSSKAYESVPSGIGVRPGYQAVYNLAALNRTQPIGAARDAALTFFQTMHNNTDAHFGLVAFSSGISSTPDGKHGADWSIASNYQEGGKTVVPFPGVPLDKTDNKLTDVLAAIPKTQAHGSTAIADALESAVNMLKKSSSTTRPGSKKAIIMFTDGQPTVPSIGSRSWTTFADTAKTEGIAIYSIGLAQNKEIIPDECDHLNAGSGKKINYKDPATGVADSYVPTKEGMASIAGNNGQFFLVTDVSDLRFVFENIARHLVQLVKGTESGSAAGGAGSGGGAGKAL